MIRAEWLCLPLHFGFTARTSRETMQTRETFLIRRRDDHGLWLYGECNYFAGLAPESCESFMDQLVAYCAGEIEYECIDSSAVRCGADMIAARIPETAWTTGANGIAINGLIWMGNKETMRQSIRKKLDAGFNVLKLKIGGINFEDEIDLLRMIRKLYGADWLELRLDANGSFTPENAMRRLECLAEYDIHSIEQPIMPGQWPVMSRLCYESPIDIALDEELIGLRTDKQKRELIDMLQPSYLILKPSLCGGLAQTDSWIRIAGQTGTRWWLTSALESSVGLMHLAGFVSKYNNPLPQGLGTGQIYTDNIGSSLRLDGPRLWCGGEPYFDETQLDSLFAAKYGAGR